MPNDPLPQPTSPVICIKCKYDAGGLNPQTPCPECSTPVAASLPTQQELYTCLTCNNILIGIDHAGTCPECNTPIRESLPGPLLVNADPCWLNKVHKALQLLHWSAYALLLIPPMYALSLLFSYASIGDYERILYAGFNLAIMSAGSIAAFLAYRGGILLSTPEPNAHEHKSHNKLRKSIRWSARATPIITSAAMIAWALLLLTHQPFITYLGVLTPLLLAAIAAGIDTHRSAKKFTASLMLRAVDMRAARKLNKKNWILQLIFLVTLLLASILILPLIMVARRLNQTRKAVARARSAANTQSFPTHHTHPIQ